MIYLQNDVDVLQKLEAQYDALVGVQFVLEEEDICDEEDQRVVAIKDLKAQVRKQIVSTMDDLIKDQPEREIAIKDGRITNA